MLMEVLDVKRSLYLTLLFILIAYSSSPQASQVVSMNISDMMKADVAFVGRCVSAEAKLLPLPEAPNGILVTSYTFEVSKVLKGDVPSSFKFMQLGASRAAAQKLGVGFIAGMPYYEAGEEWSLFLSSVTERGFRAPLGLGQGSFHVKADSASGKLMVVNNYGNKGLFEHLTVTPALSKALSAGGVKADVPEGPMEFDRFVNMVQELH
jgi:hypothetical protein